MLLCMAAVIVVFAACDGAPQDIDSPHRNGLRESPNFEGRTKLTQDKMITSLRSQLISRCDQIINSTAFDGLQGIYKQEAVVQAKAIRQSLLEKPDTPIFRAVYATLVHSIPGKKYLNVEVVNTSRDTVRLIVLVHASEKEIYELHYDRGLASKDFDLLTIVGVRGDFQASAEIGVEKTRSSNGVIIRAIAGADDVPIPKEPLSDITVAVERESGERSNFVPVRELDLRKGKPIGPTTRPKSRATKPSWQD